MKTTGKSAAKSVVVDPPAPRTLKVFFGARATRRTGTKVEILVIDSRPDAFFEADLGTRIARGVAPFTYAVWEPTGELARAVAHAIATDGPSLSFSSR